VKARSIVALAATSALLSACAVLGGSSAQPDPRTSAVARPSTATPERAVRRFADAYINWTADTVARDMSRLAAASIGQARSALQLAAAQTAGDYELKRGGIANRGTVEAVAPLPASSDQYVVVTREQTTATAAAAYQGLRPAWHVTIATVAVRGGGGWVLSGWQPES
jgi:hypothetical protein